MFHFPFPSRVRQREIRAAAQRTLFPLLTVLPAPLWMVSLLLDLIYFRGHQAAATALASYYCLQASLILTALAIGAGLAGVTRLYGDTVAFTRTGIQLVLNVWLFSLFVTDYSFRMDAAFSQPRISVIAVVISLLAVPFYLASIYLGAELLVSDEEEPRDQGPAPKKGYYHRSTGQRQNYRRGVEQRRRSGRSAGTG